MIPGRRGGYEPVPTGRYLLPHERQVIVLRQHWAFLVPPAAAAVGSALAGGVVMVIAPAATTLQIVAWVLAGFLIARLIVAGLSWFVQFITITSERVVLTSGLLNRKVKIIPLPNFAEMTFARSFAGRMVGYGAFMVEATGKPYLIIDYIPYPEQVQLELTSIAIPQPKSAEADADDDDYEPPPRRPSVPSSSPDYSDYAGRAHARPQPPSPEPEPGDAPGAASSDDSERGPDED